MEIIHSEQKLMAVSAGDMSAPQFFAGAFGGIGLLMHTQSRLVGGMVGGLVGYGTGILLEAIGNYGVGIMLSPIDFK